MQMYNPPAPDELVFEGYFKPSGIEPTEFADRIGVALADINDLPTGRSTITVDLLPNRKNRSVKTLEIFMYLSKNSFLNYTFCVRRSF